MKNLLSAIVVLALCTSMAHAKKDRVDKRQNHQRQRVKEGVKSGEITKAEAKKIHRQGKRIRKAEAMAKKDGVVTNKEKARLERMQDRRSKTIAKAKHNDKKRQPMTKPNEASSETQAQEAPAVETSEDMEQ